MEGQFNAIIKVLVSYVKKSIETLVNFLSPQCRCNPDIIFDKPAAPTVASWVGSPAVFGSHEVEVTLRVVSST